jgi:hypothetical protein
MISALSFIGAIACISLALVYSSSLVIFSSFFFGSSSEILVNVCMALEAHSCRRCYTLGIGFGNIAALNAQIGAEVGPEEQGRVQGFNYAVTCIAWATGPFAYW